MQACNHRCLSYTHIGVKLPGMQIVAQATSLPQHRCRPAPAGSDDSPASPERTGRRTRKQAHQPASSVQGPHHRHSICFMAQECQCCCCLASHRAAAQSAQSHYSIQTGRQLSPFQSIWVVSYIYIYIYIYMVSEYVSSKA